MNRDRVVSQFGSVAVVPVWVLGCGLSGNELAVYVALRSFSDLGVAGLRIEEIVARAGVSRSTVKRAIKRLEDLGLVETRVRYVPGTNAIDSCLYILRDEPLPGVTAGEELSTGVGSPRPDPQVTVDRPPVHHEPTAGSRRTDVGSPGGPTKGEVLQDKISSPLPPSAGPTAEEAEEPHPDTHAAAVALLAGHEADWRLGKRSRAVLTPAVTAALQAGWSEDDLAAELGRDLATARSTRAVLAARLADLPAPRSRPKPPKRPPWCGHCHEPTRMIEDPETALPRRCPCNGNGPVRALKVDPPPADRDPATFGVGDLEIPAPAHAERSPP